MTRKERQIARAARFEQYALNAEGRAVAANQRASAIADNIPFGQPILVGHHSEAHARRDAARITSAMNRSVEEHRKAKYWQQRAEGAANAAERNIYSDDPEAIARLEAKVAGLEAQLERRKAINAEVRKRRIKAMDDEQRGKACVQLAQDMEFTADEQREFVAAWQYNNVIGYPAYSLTNLGGNIRRNRERLAVLAALAQD